MQYLVDTQSFIWFVEDDDKLPTHIRNLMENAEKPLVISIASLWEITIKTSLGKLRLSVDITTLIKSIVRNGFTILPIEPEHLITLSTLDFIHRDPFDRIIIAQSIHSGMPVISSDDIFSLYPVTRVWKN
jgi:PIN domain nuclease of toxin-antitoxin system